MKRNFIIISLGAAVLGGGLKLQGVDGNGGPVRWRDYLPSKSALQCYLTTSVAYAARSYQQAVLASLAMAGDSEAFKAWQDLMQTYDHRELICMVGGQGFDQLATTLARVLPNIPGLSWAARQALESAVYKGLEAVRGQ